MNIIRLVQISVLHLHLAKPSLRSGAESHSKAFINLMFNKVELEIRCVGPRDLGQPGDGLGGQLNDGQVE